MVPGAVALPLLSVAGLWWAEEGEGLPNSVAQVVVVLTDHILLVWVETWRITYDADQTPFPFGEAECVARAVWTLGNSLPLLGSFPQPPL